VAAIEIVAVAFGVAYILLAIRQHRACWIAGGASTALYIVVFQDAGLPLQAALQGLYVILSVYGWLQWRPGSDLPMRPVSWNASRHLTALAGVAAATGISTALLSGSGISAAPFADSLGTWSSVAATWMLARRCIESWLWWIVIDIGLAALFAGQGLTLSAALYFGFAILAVAGYRTWRHSMTESGGATPLAAVAAELGLVGAECVALAGGLVNRSWRLVDARQDVVVRFAGEAAPALGADRESERAMQSLAAAIGLAPPILIARPDEGLLVTRHAAGRQLTREDLRDTAILERVGAWLARLHAGTPPAALAVVDFGERAAGYLATMQAAAATPATAAIAEALAARRAALPPPARLAPCHHDLHHRNFVDTPAGLVAIDWEYAGPGDPAADLASCIGYHDLGPGEIDALFAGYGAAAEDLRERLAKLAWIFDCLCYGWNGVAGAAGLAIDGAQQARLEARLAA
jgi:nicotinamide mononucleotide transporter